MKKMYMVIFALLAIFTLSACGDDDELEVTDLAGNYAGRSAVLLEGHVGQDITVTLIEYDSVLSTMIMDLESYVEERIAYFFTYDLDEEDGVGYGSVYFSFTYDIHESNPIPDGTAYSVTVYEDDTAFEQGKTELTDRVDTFVDQTQTLADALEAEGEDFDFTMDRVAGEFDQGQAEEFIDAYLEE